MIIAPDNDGVLIHAEPSVASFFSRLPDLFDQIDPTEPAGMRLALPVYLDDPDANAEWWSYMRDELEDGRSQDRACFRQAMDDASQPAGVVLDREQAHAVARVAGELRLVIAARVGIEVEEDYARIEDQDAALMDALAGLQMGVLTALDHPEAGLGGS